MSKASRKYKEMAKRINREKLVKAIPRKSMTLKSYHKWCRYCNAYIRGMKQHDKYLKGVRGND